MRPFSNHINAKRTTPTGDARSLLLWDGVVTNKGIDQLRDLRALVVLQEVTRVHDALVRLPRAPGMFSVIHG